MALIGTIIKKAIEIGNKLMEPEAYKNEKVMGKEKFNQWEEFVQTRKDDK